VVKAVGKHRIRNLIIDPVIPLQFRNDADQTGWGQILKKSLFPWHS